MNLKPETLAEIEEAIPKYPEKQSAVMPLLHAIQKDQGLLTNEAAEWVAAKLEMAPIQVLSVSTELASAIFAFAAPCPAPWRGGRKSATRCCQSSTRL